MKTGTVKVGVVGVGSLGQHHARIYSELAETHLVGIYDVQPERAAQIAAHHRTKAYPSLAALADDIDAASVVVPTDQHHHIAGQLLERGLHLLIEKPITETTAQAEELVALAAAHDRVLQVGHIERFNPAFTFLDEMHGRPRFIEAHRLAPYPPARPGLPPRGTEVSVVLDLMIHDLEVILHLVPSPIRELHAVGLPVLSSTEDIANVRILFADGCVANVTSSRITPEPIRKFRVFLEDAYVSLDYRKQTGEIRRKSPMGITREAVPIEKGEPLANELRAFARCVMTRDEPMVTGAQAARALQLAAEITRRVREGAS